MLILRKEQVKELEKLSESSFVDELVAHAFEFAPNHAKAIGEEAVRKVVVLGRARADEHGFSKRGAVRFYIEMMFLFGSDFDRDFMLPWVKDVLSNEMLKEEMHRADTLHAYLVEYLKVVAGENNDFYMSALQKMQKTAVDEHVTEAGDLNHEVVTGLKRLYPQKCDYLGDELLESVVARGKEVATRFEVTSSEGKALFSLLAFFLGYGFDEDPLFPWVSETMGDDAQGEPNERVKRLEKKMKNYLNKALEAAAEESPE